MLFWTKNHSEITKIMEMAPLRGTIGIDIFGNLFVILESLNILQIL